MKYLIILGDGMSDRPIKELGYKTPLMVADIPHIDKLAGLGRTGLFQTVPGDMPPGSEVANLAVLGYDVHKVYQGRGVLEAASIGVELEENDLAMRCNLLCIQNNKIKNHSAGHISTDEARELISYLNQHLADDRIRFFPGFSFRNLLVFKGGSNDIICTPPHDVPGREFTEVLIKPSSDEGKETADILNHLILRSQELLVDHPVNRNRIKLGKDPGNSVWFWSSGFRPRMKTLQEKFGINGAVISAVDIIKGLGIYAGMDVVEVEGATGLIDTNYEGKAEAALKALSNHDLVYLHVEATDEAGHAGDIDLKIKALEYLDKRIVSLILDQIDDVKDQVSIAILPDHATPCEVRTHTHDPVPFLIYVPGSNGDDVVRYNERSVEAGHYGLVSNGQFIKILLGMYLGVN